MINLTIKKTFATKVNFEEKRPIYSAKNYKASKQRRNIVLNMNKISDEEYSAVLTLDLLNTIALVDDPEKNIVCESNVSIKCIATIAVSNFNDEAVKKEIEKITETGGYIYSMMFSVAYQVGINTSKNTFSNTGFSFVNLD